MKKAFILVLVSFCTLFLLPVNQLSADVHTSGNGPEAKQIAQTDSASGRRMKAKDRKYWDSVDEKQMSVQNSLTDIQQKKIDYSHTKQRITLLVFFILSLIAVYRIIALGKKQKALIKLRQEGGSSTNESLKFKHEDISQTRLDRIADLKKAIKKDPKNASPYIDRADYYVTCGLITAAIKDYTKAITLDPSNAMAYWQRHLANKILGRNISADKDRVKALSLDPSLDISSLN